jgi:hypothetical protein
MILDSSAAANDITRVIETTIKARLGAIVADVETRFEDNQQGEASIYVDIFLTEDAPSPLGSRFTETQLAVKSALEARGERRFPYIAPKWPNDQYPKDVEPLIRRRRA